MHKSGLSSSLLRGLSILTGASLTLVAAPAFADVEVAPLVVIDFAAFDGTGFDPEPAAGQLDSDDWSVVLGDAVLDFGEMAGGAGSDFARGLSEGDVDDPGIWAFDVDGAGMIALGVQPTDQTFTPGQLVLRLVNNTGADVSEFQVEYTIWVNNDQARASSLDLQESADNVTYTPVGAGFITPLIADANGFTATDVVEVVTPADPIADGSQHYIAWAGDDDAVGIMERDEYGIEGITIRLLNVCGNGLMDETEGCDDGLANIDTGACTSTCAVAACGDGFVQEGVEECDDANVDDGDGCAADCTIEEEPSTTSGADTGADSSATDPDGTGSASDSDTDTAGTGSASDSASGATASATGASASDSDSDTDTDGDGNSTSASGEGEASCSCRSSSGAPIWGLLGVIGLGLARRRRR